MALPGITTVLRDRFYALSRTNVPNAPITLAIAPRTIAAGTTLLDGTHATADYDPYHAVDEQDVVNHFGYGSGAHRAYLEMIAGGAARIYIVATPATATQTDLLSTTTGNPLDNAFDAAETVQPDYIALWGRGGHPSEWEVPATPGDEPLLGFYADNSSVVTSSLAKRVADHCADITNRSSPVLGVLGMKAFVNTTNTSEVMTAAQIATQVGWPNIAGRDVPGFGTNGPYLTVVGTEVDPVTYPFTAGGNRVGEFGYANGACTFAAALSQLASESAPTSKVIFNLRGLRYNPTRTQQQAMIDQGVIPVALDFNRAPRWVDGMTYAASGSDYQRISTLRIVFDAIQVVRQKAQPFVGEGMTLSMQAALETAITSGLRGMQQEGALLQSDFTVTYDPSIYTAQIDLVLRPAFEVRNIEVSVSVSF